MLITARLPSFLVRLGFSGRYAVSPPTVSLVNNLPALFFFFNSSLALLPRCLKIRIPATRYINLTLIATKKIKLRVFRILHASLLIIIRKEYQVAGGKCGGEDNFGILVKYRRDTPGSHPTLLFTSVLFPFFACSLLRQSTAQYHHHHHHPILTHSTIAFITHNWHLYHQ